MTRERRLARAVLLTAALFTSSGCAELAGLKDREVGGEQASAGSAGGGIMSGCDPSSSGAVGPVVLAQGQDHPVAIVADETGIYWANEGVNGANGAIYTLKNGCGEPTQLALTSPNTPRALAVDGSDVYWVDQREGDCPDPPNNKRDRVMRVSKRGSSEAEVFWIQCGKPTSLVIHGADVYWTRSSDDKITVQEKASSTPRRMQENAATPLGIAADDDAIYWADSRTSRIRTQRHGSESDSATDFATTVGPPLLVVVDQTSVYWITEKALMKLEKRAAMTQPSLLVETTGAFTGLAESGTSLYVTDAGDATVLQVPKDGGDRVTIASGQGYPTGVAIDGDNVLWTNQISGEIMRAPRSAE